MSNDQAQHASTLRSGHATKQPRRRRAPRRRAGDHPQDISNSLLDCLWPCSSVIFVVPVPSHMYQCGRPGASGYGADPEAHRSKTYLAVHNARYVGLCTTSFARVIRYATHAFSARRDSQHSLCPLRSTLHLRALHPAPRPLNFKSFALSFSPALPGYTPSHRESLTD